ncbi:MAG: lasso peptide biosynthesis B2 protein [Caldilineaceae bacterium]
MLRKICHRLGLLRQLRHPADWLLFIRIFCFALLAPWRMRRSLSTVARQFTPLLRSTPAAEQQVAVILAYTELAIQVGRPLVQARCLTRGFTNYYFLRRAGVPVELHFGVSVCPTALLGHCWLVLQDVPFAEATDPRLHFRTVYALPNAAGAAQLP